MTFHRKELSTEVMGTIITIIGRNQKVILILKPDITHHVLFHIPLLAFYWFVATCTPQ